MHSLFWNSILRSRGIHDLLMFFCYYDSIIKIMFKFIFHFTSPSDFFSHNKTFNLLFKKQSAFILNARFVFFCIRLITGLNMEDTKYKRQKRMVQAQIQTRGSHIHKGWRGNSPMKFPYMHNVFFGTASDYTRMMIVLNVSILEWNWISILETFSNIFFLKRAVAHAWEIR